MILQSNKTCDKFDPPCIVVAKTNSNTTNNNDDDESTEEKIENFFTIGNIVMVSIGGLLLVLLIYSCTCFDRREPNVEYSDIKWEEGVSWVKL